jgi:hypothetical protein
MIKVTSEADICLIPLKYMAEVARHFHLINNQIREYTDSDYKFEDACNILFLEAGDDIEDLPYLNKSEKGLLCDSGLEGWPPGWCWEDWDESWGMLNIAILCNNEFGILVFCPREYAEPRLIELFDRKMKDK